MGAGGRRMMGTEAAVGAVEQTSGSVGVRRADENVFRRILASCGGVGEEEWGDDWGGEGRGFRPRNCMERCCAGSRDCVDVHGGVKRTDALGFVGGGVHFLLVVHRGRGEGDKVASHNISQGSVGLVGCGRR